MRQVKKTNDFGEKVIENFLNVYIVPEINHRKKFDKIPNDFNLKKAQIIFYPDEKPPKILLNEELGEIEATIKLKKGVDNKKGEPIDEHEIEGINNISLNDELYPNCAHATLIKLNNVWHIIFNFTYNRELAQIHLDVAEQFFHLSKKALDKHFWNAFVDNLFSAAELGVKAFFLLFPDNIFHKNTHKGLSLSYNRFAHLGNIKDAHRETFNKLSGLRPQARYFSGGKLKISEEEAKKYMKIVNEMLEVVKKRINS